MPIENGGFSLLNGFSAEFGVKVFLILFLIFYAFFALVLFRQVGTMSKKLPTSISPFLKFVSVLNIGVSLAVLFLVIGIF